MIIIYYILQNNSVFFLFCFFRYNFFFKAFVSLCSFRELGRSKYMQNEYNYII